MNKLYIEENGITAIHPAFYLNDMIEEEIYTKDELKEKLNLDDIIFKKLISGEIAFNSDIIEKIAHAFETSKEMWENLQNEYNNNIKEIKKNFFNNRILFRKEIIFSSEFKSQKITNISTRKSLNENYSSYNYVINQRGKNGIYGISY